MCGCVCICVCIHVFIRASMNLASPAQLGFELDEAGERPRDNPSGLFPYKTYGKMQKLFFPFPPTIAINISHRTFAHVPLRTGIPAETQLSWRIRKGLLGILHTRHMYCMWAGMSI